MLGDTPAMNGVPLLSMPSKPKTSTQQPLISCCSRSQSVQSKIDTSSHENSDSEHRSCDGASAAPGAGGGFGGGGARGSKRQMLPADLDGKPLPPRVMHGVDLARISAELAKSEQVVGAGVSLQGS